MSKLIVPQPGFCTEVAATLKITHAETRRTMAWEPTNLQVKHWENIALNRFTYTLKARQVFISTAQNLYNLLFTVLNTAQGNHIETWLVWDTDEKVRAKLVEIADFARQLDIEHRLIQGDGRIEFPRGKQKPSLIRGFTAGGKRMGAGLTAHLVHLSELPFWSDPEATFLAMGPAVGKSGRLHIETTMAAGSELSRRLWDEPRNQFASGKLFLSVEDHPWYKMDPDDVRTDDQKKRSPKDKNPLPPDVIAKLEDEGLTDRPTMAFVWWAYMNLTGEDWIETLREYPATPAHCFNLASGRWIRCVPEVLPHRSHMCGNTKRGDILKVYREPHEGSGQYVIGVDTAGKKGLTRHAVAVIDKKDGALAACCVLEEKTHYDLVEVMAAAQRLYTVVPETARVWLQDGTIERDVPDLVVEANGPGAATLAIARERGLNVIEYDTNAGTNELGLLEVRRHAEQGILRGPDELAQESNSLRREQKTVDSPSVFKGLKDLCMAISAAYVYMRTDPYEEPEMAPTNTRERFRLWGDEEEDPGDDHGLW